MNPIRTRKDEEESILDAIRSWRDSARPLGPAAPQVEVAAAQPPSNNDATTRALAQWREQERNAGQTPSNEDAILQSIPQWRDQERKAAQKSSSTDATLRAIAQWRDQERKAAQDLAQTPLQNQADYFQPESPILPDNRTNPTLSQADRFQLESLYPQQLQPQPQKPDSWHDRLGRATAIGIGMVAPHILRPFGLLPSAPITDRWQRTQEWYTQQPSFQYQIQESQSRYKRAEEERLAQWQRDIERINEEMNKAQEGAGGYTPSGFYVPGDQFQLTPTQKALRDQIYTGVTPQSKPDAPPPLRPLAPSNIGNVSLDVLMALFDTPWRTAMTTPLDTLFVTGANLFGANLTPSEQLPPVIQILNSGLAGFATLLTNNGKAPFQAAAEEWSKTDQVRQEAAALVKAGVPDANLALVNLISGADRAQRTLDLLNPAKRETHFAFLEKQADELRAVDPRAAAYLGGELAKLRGMSASEIVDHNMNIWAELLYGILTPDPVADTVPRLLVALPLLTPFGRATRKAEKTFDIPIETATRNLKDALKTSQELQDQLFQQAVAPNKAYQEIIQPWLSWGEKATGASYLFDLTPTSKAAVDTDTLWSGLSTILSQAITKEDFRLILHTLATNPEQLVKGIPATSPGLATMADPKTGLVAWPASLLGAKDFVRRLPLLQSAVPSILELPSLQGEGIIKEPFRAFAELYTELYNQALAYHKAPGPAVKLFGVEKAELERVGPNSAQVRYLDKDGNQIGASQPMPLSQAKTQLDQFTQQIQERSAQTNWVELPFSIQRAIMSDLWLALRPANWIRNGLSATIQLIGNKGYTLTDVNHIAADLVNKFGGNLPDPRIFTAILGADMSDAAKGASSEVTSGAISKTAAWISRRLTGKSENAISNFMQAVYNIPYGTTEIALPSGKSIAVGEQAFYIKQFYSSFRRALAQDWSKRVNTLLQQNAQELGIPPQVVEHLGRIVTDAGVTGNAAEIANAFRSAVNAPQFPNLVSQLQIPAELLPLPIWRKLNDLLSRSLPTQETEVARQVRELFQQARMHWAEIVADAPPQPGTYEWMLNGFDRETLWIADMLDDMARNAGIYTDEIAAQNKKIAQTWHQALEDSAAQLKEMLQNTSNHQRAWNIVADFWHEIYATRSAARQATFEGRRIALEKDDWPEYFANTRKTYEEMSQAFRAITQKYREAFLSPGEYQARFRWEDVVERYLRWDEDAFLSARKQSRYMSGPSKSQTGLFEEILGWNRALVENSVAEVFEAFRRYPSAANFDLMAATLFRTEDMGLAVAKRMEKIRERLAGGAIDKRAYYAIRNRTWNALFDSQAIYNKAVARNMVLNGLINDMADALKWRGPDGKEYTLVGLQKNNTWSARAQDGTIVNDLKTGDDTTTLAVPSKLAEAYKKLMAQVNEEADLVSTDIARTALREMSAQGRTPEDIAQEVIESSKHLDEPSKPVSPDDQPPPPDVPPSPDDQPPPPDVPPSPAPSAPPSPAPSAPPALEPETPQLLPARTIPTELRQLAEEAGIETVNRAGLVYDMGLRRFLKKNAGINVPALSELTVEQYDKAVAALRGRIAERIKRIEEAARATTETAERKLLPEFSSANPQIAPETPVARTAEETAPIARMAEETAPVARMATEIPEEGATQIAPDARAMQEAAPVARETQEVAIDARGTQETAPETRAVQETTPETPDQTPTLPEETVQETVPLPDPLTQKLDDYVEAVVENNPLVAAARESGDKELAETVETMVAARAEAEYKLIDQAQQEDLPDERGTIPQTGTRMDGGRSTSILPEQRIDPGDPTRNAREGVVPQKLPETDAGEETVPVLPASSPIRTVAQRDLPTTGTTPHASGTASNRGLALPSPDNRVAPPITTTRPIKPPSGAMDHRIDPATISQKMSAVERFDKNIAAIRLAKELMQSGRLPTPEERTILASFSGFGASDLANSLFRPSPSAQWAERKKELAELLTKTEFDSIRRTTLNAHYTSPDVVNFMYQALKNMGVVQGNLRILEPAAGVGNFLGLMPEEFLKNSKRVAVELDTVTGSILKLLYPNTNVHITGYEKTRFPDNSFDLIISNVPFGNYGVSDMAFTNASYITKSIHNYFFAKALKHVRPGGIVAFVTSHFTMNSKNKAVREYLARQAELIDAFLLPSNAFADNAGTNVTTAVLFLRKLEPGETPPPAKWINLEDAFVDTAGNLHNLQDFMSGKLTRFTHIQINEYFLNHPNRILGTPKLGSGLYGPDEFVIAPSPHPLTDLLNEAASAVPQNVYKPVLHEIQQAVLDKPQAPIHAGLVHRENKIFLVENGEEKLYESNPAKVKVIQEMLEVRDKARALLDAQYRNAEETVQNTLRQELNELYDKFVAANGALSDKKNTRLLKTTPDLSFISSLERKDTNGQLVKSDIFARPTVTPYRRPSHAETPEDALAYSMAEYGKVEPARIAELLGKSVDDAMADLVDKELVYKLPDNSYEFATTYLSGNLLEKLEEAQAALPYNPGMERNIAALKKVMPPRLELHDIHFRLGSSWVPPELISEFIYDKLLRHSGLARSAVKVTYVPETGHHTIEEISRLALVSRLNYELGTRDKRFLELVKYALDNKAPIIRVDGKVDKEATATAAWRIEAIHNEFKEWVLKDAERTRQLEDIYNRRFNVYRGPDYQVKPREYPGMDRNSVSLRPHQHNAIARILYSGNTLLAHDVGMGKTAILVTSIMELRRLGLANKPMLIVPNHLLQKTTKEFLSFYPNARLLTASTDIRTAANRKNLLNSISTGDWDAVIIPEQFLVNIPLRPETEERFILNELEEIEAALEAARLRADYSSTSPTVRALEKAKERTRVQLTQLREKTAKRNDTDVVFWDDMGIDYMLVDESQAFKGLPIKTYADPVQGLPESYSQRALDLYMKSRLVLDKNGWQRGLVFSTGTPLDNSIAEMYILMRYLMEPELEKLGLKPFDAWLNQFARTQENLEADISGLQYRIKRSIYQFNNGDELMNLYRQFADIVTADDAAIVTRPKWKTGGPIFVKTPRHDLTIAYAESLAQRLNDLRTTRFEKGEKAEDSIFTVTSNMRHASIDLRLVMDAPELPDSKINQLADKVAQIWHDTADKRLTQLIFCDLGVPTGVAANKKNSPTRIYNVYEEIKQKLIARGVSESDIRFIHEATTDDEKMALQQALNNGDIRILIGSTAKMGTGMNVQKLLVALHNLDVPWKPSAMEQRIGRIWRQGNQNEEIEVYFYLMEPFDDFNYWKLAKKSDGFNRVRKRTGSVGRELGADIGDADALTYAEASSLAAGNPLLRERTEVQRKLQQLGAAYRDYLALARASADAQKRAGENIAQLQKNYDIARNSLSQINDQPLHVIGASHGDKLSRSKAEKLLQEQIDAAAYATGNPLLSYRNTKLYMERASDKAGAVKGYRAYFVVGNIPEEYVIPVHFRDNGTPSATGILNSYVREVDEFEERVNKLQQKIVDLQKQYEHAAEETGRPFEHAETMSALQRRLAELNIEIDAQLGGGKGLDETDVPPITPNVPNVPPPNKAGGINDFLASESGQVMLSLFALDPQAIKGLNRRFKDFAGYVGRLLQDGDRAKDLVSPQMGDVAYQSIRTLEDAERRVLESLPSLLRGVPNEMTPAQRARILALQPQLQQEYLTSLDLARRVGQEMGREAMLDFSNRRNLDSWLAMLFPYHYFWSRMPTRSLNTALQRPQLVKAAYKINQAIQRENERERLPQRLEGSVPIPGTKYRFGVEPLLYSLFAGQMYLTPNPYVNPENATDEADRWLRRIQQFTPGLGPLQQLLWDLRDGKIDGYANFADFLPINPNTFGQMFTGRMGQTNQPTNFYKPQEFDPWRARATAAIIGKERNLPAPLIQEAQQIINNQARGLPDDANVRSPSYAQAKALAEEAIQRAAKERILSRTVANLAGGPLLQYPEAERALRAVASTYIRSGYSPENPYGSRAALNAHLDANPQLSAWWSRSQEGDEPGERAQISRRYEERQEILKRQQEAVDALLRANPGATRKEVNEVKKPFQEELDAVDEKYPARSERKDPFGLNLEEQAERLLNDILSYQPPNRPAWPGADATPEAMQLYYAERAAWNKERILEIDRRLREIAESMGPKDQVQARVTQMAAGRYTSDLIRQYETRFVSDLEYHWNERMALADEYRSATWNQRTELVKQLFGSKVLDLYVSYHALDDKEARRKMREEHPELRAALEAAFNPREYQTAVGLFGPNWYMIYANAPKHPGDGATEKEMQEYYRQLDQYRLKNPRYEEIKLWYNGRIKGSTAAVDAVAAQLGYYPRDYGQDYAELLTWLPRDTFKWMNELTAAYAQGRESGIRWIRQNSEKYSYIQAYREWYKELAENEIIKPVYKQTERVPFPDEYTGERPVGSGMKPIGGWPGPGASWDRPVVKQWKTLEEYAQHQIPLPEKETPAENSGQRVAKYLARSTKQKAQALEREFGADAGNRYMEYVVLSEAERERYRQQYPIVRLFNLYLYQRPQYDYLLSSFGRDALLAWGNMPAYGESAEARAARSAYYDRHPEAFEINAWLYGRPSTEKEKDEERYDFGKDYERAMELFGDDIWRIVAGYKRGWSKAEKASYFKRFPQLDSFFDWWYGNLPDLNITKTTTGYGSGYGRWGGGGWSGDGSGGYVPMVARVDYQAGDRSLMPRPGRLSAWRPIQSDISWFKRSEIGPEKVRKWRS